MNEHKHVEPTLYAGARYWRVDRGILDGLREIVEEQCGKAGLRAFLSVEERIYEAYAAGLTDGFTQGVMAESNRRDQAAAEFEYQQRNAGMSPRFP